MSNHDKVWIPVTAFEALGYGTKIRLTSKDGDILHGTTNGSGGANVLGGRYLSAQGIKNLGFTVEQEHDLPTEPGVYSVDPSKPDADLYILNGVERWETDRDEHTWKPVDDLSTIPTDLKRLTHNPGADVLANRIENAIAFLHTSTFPGYPQTRDRLTNILNGIAQR